MPSATDPADSGAISRLAEIRRHHGDDRPCSMRNDECFLLAEVDRLNGRLAAAERRAHVPAVTDGPDGQWFVYCLACSDEDGDWVNRCKQWPKKMPWPTHRLLDHHHAAALERRAVDAEAARDAQERRTLHWMNSYNRMTEALRDAEAKIAAVEGLHERSGPDDNGFCAYDDEIWPCPTVRALSGLEGDKQQ